MDLTKILASTNSSNPWYITPKFLELVDQPSSALASDDHLVLVLRFRLMLVGVDLGKKRKQINHVRLQ